MSGKCSYVTGKLLFLYEGFIDEKMDLESAVDSAIDEMPELFEIYSFLVGNRAEVKTMFLTEYDEEKMKKQERAEGYAEGRAEGRAEGHAEGIEKTLLLLIKSGKICKEDADEIRTMVGNNQE